MGRFQFRLNKAIQKQGQKQREPYATITRISPSKTAGTSDKANLDSRDLIPSNPRHPGFKDKTGYEVILEWDLSAVNRPFKYQRLGIASWTGFEQAVQDITRFVKTMNAVSSDAATVHSQQVVRIAGIYERGAFKDWSSDPYNAYDSKKLKKHIDDMLDLVRNDRGVKKKRPVSYVKPEDMKVR